MDTKYFMGEINLPNGIRKDLIRAIDIDDAYNIIERHIKKSQMDIDKYVTNIEQSKWAPFRPIGPYRVRSATTQEILEDQLKDFAGGWDAYSIPGFAEEIADIVLSTITRKALLEELQRREEEGDDN